MIYNVCFAASLGFAIMWTAAWILRVIAVMVQKNGKVSAMHTITISLAWAVFFFLWLQK